MIGTNGEDVLNGQGMETFRELFAETKRYYVTITSRFLVIDV